MLMQFVSANWHLFAMLVVIVFLLAMRGGTGGAKKISPLQLPQMQTKQAAAVVDVRPAAAFQKGHIARAINLPLAEIKDNLARLKKYQQQPIILVCERGISVSKAAQILRRNDFRMLYILEGGLTAWNKENLPLVKN